MQATSARFVYVRVCVVCARLSLGVGQAVLGCGSSCHLQLLRRGLGASGYAGRLAIAS